MPDIGILREHGATTEKFKKLFSEGRGSGRNSETLKPIYNRIESRIQEGRSHNFKNYQTFYALDLAWNAPLRQTSQTLLFSLIDKKADDKKVLSAINDWGLTSMVKQEDGKSVINLPVFFNILIPLVRAYVTIRWAGIINRLKNYPLLQYDPQHQTRDAKLKCEVITDRVQLVSQQYDYFSVLKQAVFSMLHYGQALQFPIESWHSEQQLVKENGREKKVYTREGLRYHIPHPTRTFIDMAHRPSTINSDSGVRFLGYWTIKRWREIKGIEGYWNLDKVSVGTTDVVGANPVFFNTVGTQCAISIPTAGGAKPGILDREGEVGFYSNDLDDQGVFLCEYFEKVENPKKEHLFDYEHPVWMRFVVANDTTILFAEALPYVPAIYYGYDSNENQSTNSSLSLEVLPSQDMVSNLLSQYILSTKQNLANLNLIDSDALDVGKEDKATFIKKLQNYGERWFRELNFEWFSSRKARNNQADIRNAVQSFRFTPLSTDGIVSAIRQILDLLERTLVMSAQEVAASASHEQTAEEIRRTAGAVATRLEFTATPVNQGIYAWKKQIYDGLMSYGEDEMYAQLTHKVDEAQLTKLGFTVEEKWDEKARRVLIKTNKSAVAVDSFASTRDADDRVSSAAQADAMSKVLGFVIGSPQLLNAIGESQCLEFVNEIAKSMGLPEDFKLRDIAKGVPPQQALVQLLQQMQDQILGKVAEGVKPIADSVVGVEQNLQAVAAQTQQNSEQLKQQAALTAKLAKLVELSHVAPQLPPDVTGQIPPLNGPGAQVAPGMAPPPGMPPA